MQSGTCGKRENRCLRGHDIRKVLCGSSIYEEISAFARICTSSVTYKLAKAWPVCTSKYQELPQVFTYAVVQMARVQST
jgi:hypothetical protein